MVATAEKEQIKHSDGGVQHVTNAPQLMLEEVGFIPRCLLFTPSGEYLGEIKITSPLRYVYVPLYRILYPWVTVPFSATLYDSEGNKLGSVKRRGLITPRLIFFTKNGEKIGHYATDNLKGVANGRFIDSDGEEIVYTGPNNLSGNSYIEDVHGNHVASFKCSTYEEENKRLFPKETVIIEFNKDREEEEKAMLLMFWATLWWMV